MIELTRAAAGSADVLMVSAVHHESEMFAPDTRVFRYDHRLGSDGWFFDDLDMDVQSICLYQADPDTRYFCCLSSDGRVYHNAAAGPFSESISGVGVGSGGRLYRIAQAGGTLVVCGENGQAIQRVAAGNWISLAGTSTENDKSLADAMAGAPPLGDPRFVEWIQNRSSNPFLRATSLFAINGLAEDDIYMCGSAGALQHWDGESLTKLSNHTEAALTGFYIESSDSVWVCGREGTLLHGSRARGFNPVPGDRGLNLFHHVAPYRGKLVMPASVRPGGLWQHDPSTGAFGRFDPPLPPLTRLPADSAEPHEGPFFAQAVGDVLWVAAPRDIFRFDGTAWERIKHPDMP